MFVKVGDKIQLQEIGLPMGTSCSPFLANLVLFMFEFEFFTNQIAKVRPWHGHLSRDSAEDSANQLSSVGCRISDLKWRAIKWFSTTAPSA